MVFATAVKLAEEWARVSRRRRLAREQRSGDDEPPTAIERAAERLQRAAAEAEHTPPTR